MNKVRSTTSSKQAPADAAEVHPVAVIDIGAGVIRLDIAEIGVTGPIRILESIQKPVNLGKETFTAGHIDPATIEECVDVVTGFRQVMLEYGIQDGGAIRAVATSAVREAANRQAFLDRVYIATGIQVDLLEDPDVELLIHLALRDLTDRVKALQHDNILAVEVGGGTTRLLLVDRGYVTYSGAFRLGVLRARENLGTSRTPPARLCAVLDEHIRQIIGQMKQSVPSDRVTCLVALAGDSAAALAAILPGWGDTPFVRLRTRDKSLAEKIVAIPVDKLMVKYHLATQDAERAGFAMLAYDRIARAFGARELLFTDLSLRRGLLLQMARGEHSLGRRTDQLIYSALALGRKFHFDEAHAVTVAGLADQLFRTLAPEHRLDAWHGMLLHTAAILHDIGAFVGAGSHHKHSQYLIMNSDIFSLTRRDTELVALIARYHRRAEPQPSHEEFMALAHADRIAVLKLAAILRLADALDRSHANKFQRMQCRREQRRFIISVHGSADVTIERAALRDKAAMFEAVYGMKVELEHAPLKREAM